VGIRFVSIRFVKCTFCEYMFSKCKIRVRGPSEFAVTQFSLLNVKYITLHQFLDFLDFQFLITEIGLATQF
jgi:hypothetical protein